MIYRQNLVNVMQSQQNQTPQPSALLPHSVIPHPQMNIINPTVSQVVLDTNAAMELAKGPSMFRESVMNLMATSRNDIWHKILIFNGSHYDQEVVLKSILLAVNPADLIPVKYMLEGENASFMARNCDKALAQLLQKSFIVNCIDGSRLILQVTLGFASIHDLKINIQPILLTALKKRYDAVKKSLDLSNFHRDPDIYPTVYCPLSQTKTLTHVVKLAKNAHGPFDYLNLQDNELFSLTLMDTANIKALKCLDLRNNEFLNVESLEPLKAINITELWLDGNPLCDNYSNASQYVEALRKICPQMSKLDGVQVNSPGMPLIFKNYIKNYNRKNLIEQFVEHFFRAYDFRDRRVLKGLYHSKAWYSTTVGTPTSPASKRALEPFGPENRNLLIFGKNSQQLLHHGEDEIIEVFKKLPPSRHIHRSFCCDLMFENDEMLIISVEGLFQSLLALNQLFSFNRTFAIIAVNDNEYKIMNDQYHINPPIHLTDHAKFNIDNETIPEFEPTCFSQSEKESLILTMNEKTTMGIETCEKYLKETGWNLKKALVNFLNQNKTGQLPKDCYK